MKTKYELATLLQANGKSVSVGTDQIGFEVCRLDSGLSAGVEQVILHCGSKTVVVMPTRGMGIWAASNNDVRFGWDSPIDGPIHPMWVPVTEPSGIGWLDGFDEMMVRCGLASNGAPEFDEQGKLVWPLHGRIANLPATNVEIEMDESAGTILVRGTVNENRFHIQRLELKTEISLALESNEISIVDRVTNFVGPTVELPSALPQQFRNANFGKRQYVSCSDQKISSTKRTRREGDGKLEPVCCS